jgi:hypothetical protein
MGSIDNYRLNSEAYLTHVASVMKVTRLNTITPGLLN